MDSQVRRPGKGFPRRSVTDAGHGSGIKYKLTDPPAMRKVRNQQKCHEAACSGQPALGFEQVYPGRAKPVNPVSREHGCRVSGSGTGLEACSTVLAHSLRADPACSVA